MRDETRAARLEGIRAKLSEGQYYGLAISDITWLGEQLEAAWAEAEKLKAWHEADKELIAQQAALLRAANFELSEVSRRGHGKL